jgi:hypothetical protein
MKMKVEKVEDNNCQDNKDDMFPQKTQQHQTMLAA